MSAIKEAGKADNSKLIAMATLILLSILAYWFVTLLIVPGNSQASYAPLLLSSIIAIVFWALILLAVFGFVLKNVVMEFSGIMKERLWAKILFPLYLFVHLIVYGIVLEKILVIVFGPPDYSVGRTIFVQLGGAFYPHTPLNALIQLTLNPSVVIFLPPFYGLELTLFSFSSATIIATLIVVHLDRLMHNAKLIRRAGGSVIYPLIGIVGGASCCISLPGLFLDFTPLAYSILLISFWVDVLNVLYYLLPISVIVFLAAGLKPFASLSNSVCVK